MKKKIAITIIGLTVVLSIVACGSKDSSTEINDMVLQQTEQENKVLDYENDTEESISLLPWIKLSALETHSELRQAFEEYFGIRGETGNKKGYVYYRTSYEKIIYNETLNYVQNVTLDTALKNTLLVSAFTDAESLEALSNMAVEYYVDIEAGDDSAPYATINAYFELLPDQEKGQFDGDATISRAQAMTLLMRATTKVNEDGAPSEDADFTSAVGKSQYTDFAAPLNEYAYINTNIGLNEDTFNSVMSKGEYIALLTNYLTRHCSFPEEMPTAKLTTITDGGTELTYAEAIKDTSKGVPTDLYSTFSKAVGLGFIDESQLSDWDTSITKAEAIQLYVDSIVSLRYLSFDEIANYGLMSEDSYELKEISIREDIEIEEYGNTLPFEGRTGISKFNAWAQSQGADGAWGWTFVYYNGEGAGDQPSYGVYMKEGPLYGTVYKVGDYLPNGNQFCGTLDELAEWQAQDLKDTIMEEGVEGEDYEIKDDGTFVIIID